MLVTSIALIKNSNPIIMATYVLVTSLMVSLMMFKATITSWVPFVTIITFSSGMMTLFMYTTSLTSNEISKTKLSYATTILGMLYMITPHEMKQKNMNTMKMFSSQLTLTIMTMLLLTTMILISNHGHNPNQTLATSF